MYDMILQEAVALGVDGMERLIAGLKIAVLELLGGAAGSRPLVQGAGRRGSRGAERRLRGFLWRFRGVAARCLQRCLWWFC